MATETRAIATGSGLRSKAWGPHQKIGDTFEYATTWRVDAAFHGTTRFCHIFQLKATEGDDGAPLITMSLEHDPNRVSVRYWSGKERSSQAAREFKCVPGEWESVRIRVKTSFSADGEVLVSVNGDPFVGVEHVAIYRPEASDYRPKWGLYRGVTAGMSLSDDYVEHRAVSARNLAGAAIENASLESEARVRAEKSAPDAIAWLEAQPDSSARAEPIGAIAVVRPETDPHAAINWTFANPNGSDRAQTLLRIYDHWQVRDIDAALKWLTAHAPDSNLDEVVWFQATDTSFRHGLGGEVLTRCASLISDPKMRRTAYEFTLARWAREAGQKTAATEFALTQANASPTERQALAAKLGGSNALRGAAESKE